MTTASPLRPLPQTDADPFDAVTDEIARLELLRRLSAGAAHTLNNAFTAMLGETLCLLDERKHDPLVAEVCQLLQAEVERCVRLTRSVALRVQRREPLLDEADLGALLRTIEPLLRETVSRSIVLECEAPVAARYVRGPAEDLEQLLLLCAHRLVRDRRGGGVLRVSCWDEAGGTPRLVLAVEGPRTPGRARENGSWDDLVARAVGALAARHGVELREESDGDDVDAIALRFTPVSLEE